MEEVHPPSGKWVSRKRSKAEELDFGGIIRLFLRHKVLIIILAVSAIFTAALTHILYPSFKVNSSIQVRSNETNMSQAVTNRLTTFGLDVAGRLITEKYLQQLNSFDFFLSTARYIKTTKEFEKAQSKIAIGVGRLARIKGFFRKVLFLKKHPYEESELSDLKLAVILSEWCSFSKMGSDIISISVTTPNADVSLILANLMADLTSQYLTENELKELDDAERYIKVQLEQSERATRDIESEIVEFKKSNNLLSIETGNRDVGTRALEIRRELEEISVQVVQNVRLIDSLTKELNEQGFLVQETEQANASSGARPKFGLSRRIEELKRENQYLNVRKSTLNRIFDDIVKSQDPTQEQHIVELRKKIELQYGLYQEVKKQLFQIEMQRIVMKHKVRPFEKAQDFEIKRNVSLKKKIGLALLLAILIGGFSAYVWELLVPTVKTRHDLDELNFIFLGSIPDLSRGPQKNRQFQFKPTGNIPMLCRFDIDSSASMAFKYIRARIQHISESQTNRMQVVTILSANHSEGKSFVAANIGACISFMKKKTLLIDCDLRKATASQLFRVNNVVGLSEVLKGTVKFGAVVKQNVLPKLDVLPSGTFSHDITELIASQKFSELLSDLRSLYDYIILDTPPLISVPDSALVAKRSDMLILIATANRTTIESVERAWDCIWDFGGKNIYTLLNRVDSVQDYVYVVPQNETGKNQGKGSGGPDEGGRIIESAERFKS